jgi:hypothetical protein
MKTYTLFLADITEDDLAPDGSEFDSIREYEDYESSSKAPWNQDTIESFADLVDPSDSSETSCEINDSDEFHIPEISSTYDSLFTVEDDTIRNIGITEDSDRDEQYDEIPAYYSGINTWIKSTNIHCISCSNKIQGMPLFIPLSWHSRLVAKPANTDIDTDASELDPLNNYQLNETQVEQKVMKVHFLTCNERCAERYINKVKDAKITDKWQSLQLLKEVVQDMKKIKITEIQEGLDKNLMMQYCGPSGISVQRFRELNESKY